MRIGGFVVVMTALLGATASAQRPTDPAMLVPQDAPPLDYVVAPAAVTLPAGVTMNATAAAAFDRAGHLIVLTRSMEAFYEFDANGVFVRSFGGNMFTRAHGIKVDAQGSIWATDVGAHLVHKVDRTGKILLTLGTKGEAGEWNEAAGSRKLNQPTDIAIAANGDVFVSQGHTPGPNGDARVLKFDKDGKFLAQWGGKGNEPGKFQVAHGLAIDPQGNLWVADRENQRIQVFTPTGAFVREMKFNGVPCSIAIGPQGAFMVNGYAAQIVQMDLNGKVLAVMGKSGKGPGEFGEAHVIAVSPKNEIFVADSVNATLQKFVKK